MSLSTIFDVQLILGYVAWLICFRAYAWPWLRSMPGPEAQRLIAVLHSFRFFGLVFIVPGVVGPDLPTVFATYAAWGDFATGLLALLALMTARVRPVFRAFVLGYTVVGIVDLLVDYYNAVRLDLALAPGQLCATYVIPILYVPILMITHIASLYLLTRPAGAGVEQRA